MNAETFARRVNAEAAARAERAAELRVAGATWSQIAEQTGYSAGTHARRAVVNYLGELPTPDREAARTLLRERVELLWQVAERDAREGKPGALRAAVAVLQRAAQLDGLDQPQQVEFYSPSQDEYSRLLHATLELHRQQTGAQQALEADIFSDEFTELAVVEVGADPLAPQVTTP